MNSTRSDTNPDHRETAADQLVAQLIDEGVDVVFGLPGEENLALASAFRHHELPMVVCRHEQHAAFMAVAHARLTGNVGVCISTLGPGALNLFTGLAQAQLMGVPVLAITGQKANRNNDEGSFQVIDVVGAARPIVAKAVSVTDPAAAGAIVLDALSHAREAPGAVLVELPEDVAEATVSQARPRHHARPRPQASEQALNALVEAVNAADRPVLLAGSACANPAVADALRGLSSHTGLSVLATQMGKGSIDELNPRSLRALGIHRPDYAHAALARADLVIAVGYQPVEHPPLAWHRDAQQPVIHLHAKPAHIEPGYEPSLEVVGDLSDTLERFSHQCPHVQTAWSNELHHAINACLRSELAETGDDLSVARVVEIVQEAAGDAVVALDNGLYKIWFARHYAARSPHSLVLDNALATMGAGLATGMEAARLGHRALVVTGDGGLMMNVGDLETAARLGLDLTVLVLRDDAYGFIGWHQSEQGRDRADVDVTNPDLDQLARSFAADAVRVTAPADLVAALDPVKTPPGLRIIDCPVGYECTELLERDGRVDEVLAQLTH